MKTPVPDGLAEQTEIEAYADFVTGASAPVRKKLGIDSLRIGPVLALAIREDPSRYFNRTGGFATSEQVTVDVLARVRDFYRRLDVSRGAFMIAPSLLPPDWAETAGELNLTEGTRYVKLWCETERTLSAGNGAATLGPGLRVGPIEPHHAQEWASVMMGTFGFTTPGMADMAASCVGRPGWQQYAVRDGERIISVGSIFVNGPCADMFGGATLPECRGLGAQSALLAVRARAAHDAGCRWIVADTEAEGPDDHNTSLHNMLRLGFEPLYERVTLVLRE